MTTRPTAFQKRPVTMAPKPSAKPMKTRESHSLFSDFDLHLFGEGNHHELYRRLGAHVRTIEDRHGVSFAVWAPNAKRVAVVGDFNGWDSKRHVMTPVGRSGIWERFIPDLGEGALYKFHLTSESGDTFLKADPFAFACEQPPDTASVVNRLGVYEWRDSDWMEERAKTDWHARPMAVYEVHLGSWQTDGERENGWLNYRAIAPRLVDYCRQTGFTHVELMPVSEHPYTGSWGYQTLGYYAATSRYGRPDDLRYFVDYCHQHGIGVIVDWVPAHFPRDAFGLARFDGTALFEHADPRQGAHPDWGTLIFNYGRNEVRNFLVANALFWCDEYHIDGLRVDAVASMLYLDYSRDEGQWLPNRYGGKENLEAISMLRQMNTAVHERFPGVMTIAEESTSWPRVSHPVNKGGLGFDFKWNMGWMNDTLKYMRQSPIHRKYHHDQLTFSLMYAFSENFILPFSHDEVVHGKGSLLDQMSGDQWQKFANLRLLYMYMWGHPGKKLLFMGNEFAQWKEWNCEQSLNWDLLMEPAHRGIQKLVTDLNQLLKTESALYSRDYQHDGFQWIDCHDSVHSTISWIRRGEADQRELVFACNFTPEPLERHQLGVPRAGTWREVINSDAKTYEGSGWTNLDPLAAKADPSHGQPASLEVRMPPLGGLILAWDPADATKPSN